MYFNSVNYSFLFLIHPKDSFSRLKKPYYPIISYKNMDKMVVIIILIRNINIVTKNKVYFNIQI